MLLKIKLKDRSIIIGIVASMNFFSVSLLLFSLLGNFLAGVAAQTVVSKVFLDFRINNQPFGRILVGLYDNDVPNVVTNFLNMAQQGGAGRGESGANLYYAGTTVFSVTESLIKGGDVVNNDGTGHDSYFGIGFEPDNYNFPNVAGSITALYVGRNEAGNNIVSSQFAIITDDYPEYDGTNVVFGEVLEGRSILDVIQMITANQDGPPTEHVTIFGSSVVDNEAYGVRRQRKAV